MIKLICLDMDGILIKPNKFWMDLHKKYGTLEEGIELTKRYLKTDYKRLVEEVIGRLWAGKPASDYFELVESMEFMDDLDKLFKTLDNFQVGKERAPRAIITGGAFETAQRIQKEFGIDHIFANKLNFRDGVIAGSGDFEWPVGQGGESKARIVKQLCDEYGIQPQQVLFIGDSGIDLDAFKIVGHSIAFNSENTELKKEATYVVDSGKITDILPVLEEIQSQDSQTHS